MGLGFRQRLPSLSLLQRIVIANTVIIVAGAVGGTLVTVQLVNRIGELSLILAFVAVGVLISFIINWLLVRAALRPLYQLRDRAGIVARGGAAVPPDVAPDADRDVRQLAQALDALVRQLEKRNHELQALSQRIIYAQEAERKRIARGLHDDTSQYLSMLIVQLERLEQRLPMETDILQGQLAACREMAQRTLAEFRKIIHGLRPTILDDLGLVPAIRWYGRSLLGEAGIQVSFNLPAERPRLTNQQNETLFRIAQEAITNIAQHAGSCQATINLVLEEGTVCLEISDNGRGFDPQNAGENRLGIVGMGERAALIQAQFAVDSVPGRGTRVRVRVPWGANQEGEDGED